MSEIQREYPFLNQAWYDFFENQLSEFWSRIWGIFSSCLTIFERVPGTKLYSTSLSRQLNRCILAAWRYAQKSVIGFSHGNTFAHAFETGYWPDLMTIASEIETSSKGEAVQFDALAKQHSWGLKMAKPRYPTQSRYKQIFEELHKTKKNSQTVKKVMLVGFPLSNVFYTYIPSHHDFSSVHLEITLSKLLREQGYHIIYKAHPDRLKEAEGLFNSYVDQISPLVTSIFRPYLYAHLLIPAMSLILQPLKTLGTTDSW